MNRSLDKESIAYSAVALILVAMLVVLLAFSGYLRWKLGYAMILVGWAMFVVSLLTGAIGVALSLRAYARNDPIGIWLSATALAFAPAIVYIFLVVRNLRP